MSTEWIPDLTLEALMAEPQAGFKIESASSEEVILRQNHDVSGCLSAFSVLLIIGLTIILVAIPFGLVKSESGETRGWPAFALCAGLEAVIMLVASYMLLRRTLFRLTETALIRETFWLGTYTKHEFPANDMRVVKQWRDANPGAHFRSWSLAVEERRPSLLSNQPYESSFWLGRLLALRYGATFIAARVPAW